MKDHPRPNQNKDAEDDTRFNETLKRMLQTPPKPHEKAAKDKSATPVKNSEKSAKKD
jgi:hypothetical protein